MAARLPRSTPEQLHHEPLPQSGLSLLALLTILLALAPAHAGSDRASFTPPRPLFTISPQAPAQTMARAYPAPVRLAYPNPTSPQPVAPRLDQPTVWPIAMDPLAVCPAPMQIFLNNSSHRSLPVWVAARSCDCYAQERAQGTTQEQSSRRCFP
ncbi:MAG: hypothetical protein ACK5N0_05305 [Synechococcaceae cyanobacterium]